MAAKKPAAKKPAKKPAKTSAPKSKPVAKKRPSKASPKKTQPKKSPAKTAPPKKGPAPKATKPKAAPKPLVAKASAPANKASAPANAAPPKPTSGKPVAAPVAPAPIAKPAGAPAPAAPVPAAKAAAPAAGAPKHGGISDEAVRSATGRGWDEWFTLIDGQNGATLDHRSIVAIVAPHLQKSEWWAQMVTVAYEQARGLRKKHEKTDGFQVGASRVLEVSVSRIYAAFFDPTLRARWLPDPVTIKAATMDKSLRMSWKDNTPIDVYLYAKAEDRASVAVQHGKIKDEATAAERKAFWKAALERLAALLVRR